LLKDSKNMARFVFLHSCLLLFVEYIMARTTFLKRLSYLESIRSRMLVAGITLLILFLLALWAFRQTSLINSGKLKDAVWVYYPLQSHTHKVTSAIGQYRQYIQEIALTADTTERKTKWVYIEKIWKQSIQSYRDTLATYLPHIAYSPLQDHYKTLIFKLKNHRKLLSKLESQIMEGNYEVYLPAQPIGGRNLYAHKLLLSSIAVSVSPQMMDILEIAQNCESKIYTWQVTQYYDSQNTNFFTSWVFWLLWFLGSLGCVWWMWQIREMHYEDMELLSNFPNVIQKGDIPSMIEPQLAEHKPLAHKLNTLIRPLTELRSFAQQINKETTQTIDLQLFGKRGELGQALTQMHQGLVEKARENNIRNIINTGLANFADIFAKYAGNSALLADTFIAQLVNYLKANQAGLFLLENQDGKAYLELKAAFAYSQKRYAERIIEPGQSLIGQVWKEGETTYMRNVPQNYVHITSGLGEATPSDLLIVPLKVGESVLGVVEIASFHEITPYQREFVEKVAQNLAQVIANGQQAEQTKYLLQESQALAYNLQIQEEALQEKMQALQLAQNTMQTTQRELVEKENNLKALINNTSHAIVAFDRMYRITVINKSMRQMYLEQGILLDLDKNLLEEMPSNEFTKRHKDFFRVLSGEKFVTLERIDKATHTLYYELHYNPIFNETKQVLGASIFIENITQQKMSEFYLKETEANLNSLINDTEDAIMALDKNCKILIFNKVYAKQFIENGYQLQRGKSIFDCLSSEKQVIWREYYDRALAGERFMKVLDIGTFPEKIYHEHWFNPIREGNEVTGLSIFKRDITQTRKAEMQNKQTLLESLEETQKLKEHANTLEKQLALCQRKLEDLQSNPS